MIPLDEDEESNYPYVTARVRAKKAKLFRADAYQKMLLMSVPEIGRYLGETEYRKEMAQFGGTLEGAWLVEVATYRNLANVLKDILRYCESGLREMVASYLGKWDAYNLKVVLRGRYASAPESQIEGQLIPAGSFNMTFLRSLMKKEGVDEIVSAARKAGLPLSDEALQSFLTSKRLSTLEDDIDRGYYSRLLATDSSDEAKSVFISFVRREIDVHNLQTILRLKTEGLQPQQKIPYLVPGGRDFGIKSLRQFVELSTIGEMLNAIRSHRSYAQAVPEASGKSRGWGELRAVAIALDKVHAVESQKLERLYPLSVLPVLDYMLRKELEVKNIRILARGKQSGLSEQEIRSVLVY